MKYQSTIVAYATVWLMWETVGSFNDWMEASNVWGRQKRREGWVDKSSLLLTSCVLLILLTVVQFDKIRYILISNIMKDIKSINIDFVLAFGMEIIRSNKNTCQVYERKLNLS